MFRSSQCILAAAMLAAVPAAHAASTATIDGTPVLSIMWGPESDPDNWTTSVDIPLEGTDFSSGPLNYGWGGDQINVSFISGDVDPVMTIAVGFVDNGAPSVFSFSLSAPLAPPVVGLANYSLLLNGSFTDGGSDGGSVSTSPLSTYGILDAQLDFVSFAGTGAGAVFGTPGGLYGPYTANGVVNCGAGCNDFGILISAKGSGGGDAMSFTGRFEITTVPVPAAAWLFAPAVGVLGFLRRRSSAA